MKCSCHRHAHLILSCALGLSLMACGKDSLTTTSPTAASASTAHDLDRGNQDLNQAGQRLSTRQGSSAPTSQSSFAALMQRLSALDQTRVRGWYRRIAAPEMDDATPEQFAWMRARHYPMPEDIARAESMSNNELRAAANGGDITAKILYEARLLEEYNAYVSAGMTYDNMNRLHLLDEINAIMPQILASGSPYAGYLYAARSRLMHPRDVEQSTRDQLAGLVWASKLGDTRADMLLDTPVMQAVVGGAGASAMSLMLARATMAGNPPSFTTPIVPIPPAAR